MFGEVGDKALGILVTGVCTPIVAWLVARAVGLLKWRPRPIAVYIGSISTVISLIISALFILTYDRGLLPFTREAERYIVKHKFGEHVPNKSRGTWLVTVSARHNRNPLERSEFIWNGICAAVAQDSSALPTFRTGNCGDDNTVASANFSVTNRIVSISFVVPKDWSYNVLTDGGDIEAVVWTENLLR